MTSLGDLVAQQLNQSLDQLNIIWKEIGLTDDEKQDKLQCVFESVQKSIRHIVLEADQQRQNHASDVEKIRNFMTEMQHALRFSNTVGQLSLDHLPLRERVAALKKESAQYEKLYHERVASITKLNEQKRNIQKMLYVDEGSFVDDDMSDLSKEYLSNLTNAVKSLEDEKLQREKVATDHLHHIDRLLLELAASESCYQIKDKATLLFTETLILLQTTRKELEGEKQRRRTQLDESRGKAQRLWTRLDISAVEADSFTIQHPLHNLSMDNLRAYEKEINRLNDLKLAFLVRFIAKTREELTLLWARMGYTDDQGRQEAPFAYITDAAQFTEELLNLHESYVEKLHVRLTVLEPILEKIQQHQSMRHDVEEFEIQSKDPERLFKRDPGRLLREEKFRKIISHKLPVLEKLLREEIAVFERDFLHGQQFHYQGQLYFEYLDQVEKERRGHPKDGAQPQRAAFKAAQPPLPSQQQENINEPPMENQKQRSFTYTSSLVANTLGDGKKTSLPLPRKV